MLPSLNKAWAGAMSLLGDRVFQIRSKGDGEETTLSPSTTHKEEIQHQAKSTSEEKLQRTRERKKQLRDYKGKELGTNIRTIEHIGED